MTGFEHLDALLDGRTSADEEQELIDAIKALDTAQLNAFLDDERADSCSPPSTTGSWDRTTTTG